MEIQSYEIKYLEAVIRLSLRAWEPVFVSIESVIKPDVRREFYPQGWRVSQRQAVEDVCAADEADVWVAIEDAEAVGFVAVKIHSASKMGEIYMIAVEPNFQGRGIAAALTNFALDWMKDAGMSLAMVETGGDSGHAPARRLYEKTGFDLLPIARYFKKL